MTTADTWTATLADDPTDADLLVYSDWLRDTHGDEDRAEFIRLSVELETIATNSPCKELSHREDPRCSHWNDYRGVNKRCLALLTAHGREWAGETLWPLVSEECNLCDKSKAPFKNWPDPWPHCSGCSGHGRTPLLSYPDGRRIYDRGILVGVEVPTMADVAGSRCERCANTDPPGACDTCGGAGEIYGNCFAEDGMESCPDCRDGACPACRGVPFTPGIASALGSCPTLRRVWVADRVSQHYTGRERGVWGWYRGETRGRGDESFCLPINIWEEVAKHDKVEIYGPWADFPTAELATDALACARWCRDQAASAAKVAV